MATTFKHLRVALEGYKATKKTHEGREYYAVPVTALVEGVIHASNAKNPEMVRADEFSYAVDGWNGRPVFHNHPVDDAGDPVSGNTPETLEKSRIGWVFDAASKSKKLKMAAWVDIERCKEIAPDLLDRIEAGETIEVSVGAFVSTDDEEGEFEGKKFLGAWHDIVPDHLALLDAQTTGACSVEAGCGVRAAKGAEMKFDKPADVKAAVANAKTRGEKKQIIAAAYQGGTDFVKELPKDWQRKVDTDGNMLTRVLQAVGLRAAQAPEEMSGNDLSRKLTEALREVESRLSYVETFYPIVDPKFVVFSVSHHQPYSEYYGYSYCLYEREFTLDSNGKVVFNGDRAEVEAVTSYRRVTDSEPIVAEAPKDAAAGAPCSCHKTKADAPVVHNSEGKDSDMDKKARVKALLAKNKRFAGQEATLEAASEEMLTLLEAEVPATEPVKKDEEPPVTPPVAAPVAPVVPAPVAAAAVEPTFENLLAKASPDVRAAIEAGTRAAASRKAATIAALKATQRCKVTDEKLAAMSQADLDDLASLADVPAVASTIDFSGAGLPRAAAAGTPEKEVPAAPDFVAAFAKPAGK